MKWNFNFLVWAALAACVLGACTKEEKGEDSSSEPSVESFVNLTKGGRHANCFIVEKPGEYAFKPCRVDGSRIEGIATADWLWSTAEDLTAAGTEGHSKGLIQGVKLEDGLVHFEALDGKGNAVIAVLDEKGQILWSWHMWLTEMPGTQVLDVKDNRTVFMDRNLGAMSARPEDLSKTWGLKYQWGRKDPFFGGDRNEAAEEVAFARAFEGTVVNPRFAKGASSASAGWKAVESDAQSGTVEYTIAHPMTFLYTSRDERDWLFVRNDALWLDAKTGGKTNYDPCPAGYYVPREDSWANCNYTNVFDDPDHGGRILTTDSGVKFFWPLTGTRWGDKDAGRLGYAGVGGSSTYWMCNTNNCGFNANCFYIHQGTYVSSSYGMYRAHGVNVRCTQIPK